MSNYTKTVDFSAKDALTSGDPNKIISGTEINTEFTNIQTSNNTKATITIPTVTSNMAGLNASGDLEDSGFLFSGIGGEVTASATNLSKTNTTASQGDLDAVTNFEETVTATTSEVEIKTTKTLNVKDSTGLKIADVVISPVVQKVTAVTTAFASGSTTMPADDTIPQNTEGTEFLTVTITPKYNNSTLYIDFTGNVYTGASSATISTALFQDSTAGAIASTYMLASAVATTWPVTLSYAMTSGTTSSTTFKIRIGAAASSTVGINGATGRVHGGVMQTRLTVTEII